ncbi:MAG: MOSC domain-containing protein, partial [Bosea sp. (in: a-proteobacteria)]
MSSIRVASLYRYPVKGLSPERLNRVTMAEGAYFPGARMFAIENGPSGFDAAAPEHQPKIKFLMLMKQAALARLQTRYDDASETLHITVEGKPVLAAQINTEAGRADISAFFQLYLPDELRGLPKWLSAPDGFRFTDSRSGYVSLINLASVAALEQRLDAPVDPLRFRGNIHLEGLKPWAEFDLVGQELEGPSGLR